MKNILLKLASQDSNFRKELIHKLAIQFDTQDQFDKYMKEHPKAKKERHSVVKQVEPEQHKKIESKVEKVFRKLERQSKKDPDLKYEAKKVQKILTSLKSGDRTKIRRSLQGLESQIVDLLPDGLFDYEL